MKKKNNSMGKALALHATGSSLVLSTAYGLPSTTTTEHQMGVIPKNLSTTLPEKKRNTHF